MLSIVEVCGRGEWRDAHGQWSFSMAFMGQKDGIQTGNNQLLIA